MLRVTGVTVATQSGFTNTHAHNIVWRPAIVDPYCQWLRHATSLRPQIHEISVLPTGIPRAQQPFSQTLVGFPVERWGLWRTVLLHEVG